MKFSFVNPGPNPEFPAKDMKKMIGAAPPLGMMYIATILRREGIEVSMIDEAAQAFSIADTVDWVKKEDPDLLGFSTCSSSGRKAAMIAERVKAEDPNVVIVFGNFHATFNAERILRKYPSVDAIVRGEGENTSLELVKCLEKDGDLKEVMGITFREGGRVIANPDRPLIQDVDSIPFPDRGLLNVEYHNTAVGIDVAPKKFTTFVSSRGCVFGCRFCGCRGLARNQWRSRSVENVLEELQLLAGEGYKQLMFVDDNFTLNPKRVIEMCRRMREERIDLEWICEGRVDQCPYDMIHEMVKAGCKMMYFGIESANQRILEYYDKQITSEQAEAAVRNARKAGMDVIVGSFIVGAPDETREEIENTLRFAQELQIDIPQFNILAAFPGTDIWEELSAKGVIDEEKHWEAEVPVSDVSPKAVPRKEIERMVHEGYQRFLTRPSYVLAQLLRFSTSSYRLNVLANNLGRMGTIADSVRTVT